MQYGFAEKSSFVPNMLILSKMLPLIGCSSTQQISCTQPACIRDELRRQGHPVQLPEPGASDGRRRGLAGRAASGVHDDAGSVQLLGRPRMECEGAGNKAKQIHGGQADSGSAAGLCKRNAGPRYTVFLRASLLALMVFVPLAEGILLAGALALTGWRIFAEYMHLLLYPLRLKLV